MEQGIVYIIFAIVGAALGSFAGAQVWRLRAAQLTADKKTGEKVDEKELKQLKPLIGKKLREDRSQCLSCGHALRWYDLLPVVSWLWLRGKCRYCQKPIGIVEFLLEVGLGAAFVLSATFWSGSLMEPLEMAKLALWLVALVVLSINLVYDARWFLLVSGLNWLLIGLGLLFAVLTIIQAPDTTSAVWSTVWAVAILGGLYGVLWLVSKGRWVGEGDIYLGAGLALFLGDWKLAFVALFAANLIGTLIVLPPMLAGKLKRGTHIPFGPLLIIGAILTWFIGPTIVDWYESLMFLP